jgi:hypothetical protein
MWRVMSCRPAVLNACEVKRRLTAAFARVCSKRSVQNTPLHTFCDEDHQRRSHFGRHAHYSDWGGIVASDICRRLKYPPVPVEETEVFFDLGLVFLLGFAAVVAAVVVACVLQLRNRRALGLSRDSEWEFFGAVPDGQSFTIDGMDVWKHGWMDTKERAHVKDPHSQQDFTFYVWEIRSGDHIVNFAAGEFSNCMWGFYVRKRVVSPSAPANGGIVDHWGPSTF